MCTVITSVTLALFYPASTSAQHALAAVNGIVIDPTGAAIDKAVITLTAGETGLVRTTLSNGSGAYVFVSVPPASYNLKAVKDGFNSVSKPKFQLFVNQTATHDFQLEVGSKAETMTVVAHPDIQSSTAELGTVIAEKAVNELPLNGRNFTRLLSLSPGASPISVAQNAAGGSAFAGNAVGSFSFPAINGQRNRSNMFLLDGANNLGSFLGNYNFAPIIDTVQEFKVQSHNDAAEFGQALGGIVNVVTKSGTNEYHGSVWEFLRNEQFDARNFFADRRNPLRQNQFGVAGGGPIQKNRTFFYGGYEGHRQSEASSNPLLVPTQSQLGGNLSSESTTIYDPFTTVPDPNNSGTYVRTPFGGNLIPQNRLSPAALEWAKLFPAPGSSQVAGFNVTDTTPQRTNQDSYQIRVDQVFRDRDIVFGRISYYTQARRSSGGFPGAVNGSDLKGWNWALTEIHTFGPSAILDLHFARNQGDVLNTTIFPNAPSQTTANLIASGFAANFISNYRGREGPSIPTVAISGFASAGEQLQDTRLADTWQSGGTFIRIIGRHNLKMGVTAATNNTRSPVYYSHVNFTSFETSNLQDPAGAGSALASFLLGVPNSARRVNAFVATHGGWIDGLYIQDQWKVNNRLTLNIGLRWDVTLWPIYGIRGTPDSYVGDLNLNNGTYILTGVPATCSSTVGFPCIPGGVLPPNVVVTGEKNGAIYRNSYDNWQGRFGFGYRLTDRIAVRGGYGRFYDNWNSVIQLAQNYGGTWPNIAQLTASNLNRISPTVSIGDPLNLGSGSVQHPAENPFNQVAFFVDPTGYKLPYSDQWNFGFEQSVGKNTIVSAAYVGAHSLQLNVGGYKNVARIPAPGDAAAVAARRPYPYITPTFYDQSIGQSSFNSLQLRLEGRGSVGLAYLLSYTWSKSIDTACSGNFGVEGCGLQNPYNINADRSVSGFDIPHNFNASWNWEIPFGKGKKYGGWQINGILSLYSGVPFDVTVRGDIANTGNNYERADLIRKDAYATKKGPNGWINPAAFAVPANYTFGNLGRNSLRTDWTKNLDLSLFRRFPIYERLTLEFRAESFNSSNTAVFGQPSSTINAVNFGAITSTRNRSRELQFALKILF